MYLKFYYAEYNLCQLTIKLHKRNLCSLLCFLPSNILCHKHRNKRKNAQTMVTIKLVFLSVTNVMVIILSLQKVHIAALYSYNSRQTASHLQITSLYNQPFLELPHYLPTDTKSLQQILPRRYKISTNHYRISKLGNALDKTKNIHKKIVKYFFFSSINFCLERGINNYNNYLKR